MFLPNWAAVPCRRVLGNRKFRGQAMTAPPAIMGVAGYQETLEPKPSRARGKTKRPPISIVPPAQPRRPISKRRWRRRAGPRWLVRRAPHQAISLIRSDLSFGANLFLRICHSRRLSAKLELPDPLGRTILQTPTSDKALRPAWPRFVMHLTLSD